MAADWESTADIFTPVNGWGTGGETTWMQGILGRVGSGTAGRNVFAADASIRLSSGEMEGQTYRSRRKFLRKTAVGFCIAVGGCANDKERRSSPAAPETTGNDSHTSGDPTDVSNGDGNGTTQPAVISSVSASTGQTSGILYVHVQGRLESGSGRVRIDTPVDSTERDVRGSEVTVEAELRGEPGSVNDVRIEFHHASGTVASDETTQYVREYDTLTDRYADVGAYYIPFTGQTFDRCIPQSGWRPTIGEYGLDSAPNEIPPAVTSKHIDQMTGHGINRVQFVYEGRPQSRRFLDAFLRSDLQGQITLQPVYTSNAFRESMEDGQSWRNQVLPRDLSILRDRILSRDAAGTYDGRPVVELWNATWLVWHKQGRQKLLDEWEDIGKFVEHIRSHLRENGRDPFLIADVQSTGAELSDDWGVIGEFARNFDAVTTWTASSRLESGETIPWDGPNGVYEYVTRNFEETLRFATEHDLEFVPKVFPGFDDRHNQCWGEDRHIPRSPDYFRRLFELADEFRTTDMIDISTWNDWAENAIEPGTWRDREFGETYVDIVRDFQQSGPR